MKRHCILGFISLLLLAAPPTGQARTKNPVISVGVLHKYSFYQAGLRFHGDGPIVIVFENGKAEENITLTRPGGTLFHIHDDPAYGSVCQMLNESGQVLERWGDFTKVTFPGPEGDPYGREVDVVTPVKRRRYRGQVSVINSSGRLRVLVSKPVEDFIPLMTISELSVGDQPEVLKAQAVAIRSYLLTERKHRGFDFCDTEHCLVFLGQERRPRSLAPFEEVRGKLITHNGRPIHAYFSYACGGHTATPDEVWGNSSDKSGYRPQSFHDEFCVRGEVPRWQVRVPKSALTERLSKSAGFTPGPRARFEIGERDAGGQVQRVVVIRDGSRQASVRTGTVRSVLNSRFRSGRMKSNLFEIADRGSVVEFQGRGWGHNVGMCQQGARKMAELGYRWDDILRYYYPGAEVAGQTRYLPDYVSLPTAERMEEWGEDLKHGLVRLWDRFREWSDDVSAD